MARLGWFFALAVTATTAVLAHPVAAGPSAPDAPDDPAFVYRRDCASCHGEAGYGTRSGPPLFGVGRASLDFMLSTGRMPAPLLSGASAASRRRPPAYPTATIRRLVDYVAGFGGGGPDVPRVSLAHADLGRGGELFRLNCAACHEWAGTGGALLHREAPSLSRATPVQVAEAVRIGPGTMPAFGPAALGDEDVADVAAYVRSLRHPRDRGGLPLAHIGPLAEGAVAWVAGMGILVLAARRIVRSTPRLWHRLPPYDAENGAKVRREAGLP